LSNNRLRHEEYLDQNCHNAEKEDHIPSINVEISERKTTLNCPECSSQNVYLDSQHYEYVCKKCGCVLEEEEFEGKVRLRG
jgi:transposase-like protein